jgi:hypothetical protein
MPPQVALPPQPLPKPGQNLFPARLPQVAPFCCPHQPQHFPLDGVFGAPHCLLVIVQQEFQRVLRSASWWF